MHHGHINLIKQGQKYGKIIVGLISDKAIAQNKRIPLLNYNQRKILEDCVSSNKEIEVNNNSLNVSIKRIDDNNLRLNKLNIQNNLLNVIFILITEQISFIPNNIIECCNVIYVPKPSACQMKTIGAFKTIHYDNLKSKKTKTRDIIISHWAGYNRNQKKI